MFHVEELIMAESSESITLVEEDIAEISIPSEVLEKQEGMNPIRTASFLFRNMSGLLPQRLGNNEAENDRYIRVASQTISF